MVEVLGGGMAAYVDLSADRELTAAMAMVQQANNNSGYIGAGIVGTFVLVVGGWYGGRWAFAKRKRGT